MMRMNCLSPEAYVVDASIVAVGPSEIAFLKDKVLKSPRKRTRLCAHTSTEDKLHEMFVVYTGSTYVRPNLHCGKDESLHILEGRADFVFFDEHGNVTEVVRLGDSASGLPFYCRVPAEIYHTVLMRSDRLVIHEATPGPFRREDTLWASWAPTEDDLAGVEEFNRRMTAEIERRPASGQLLGMRKQSPEVFLCEETVGKVGRREIDFLKAALPQAARKRVRVCIHKSGEDRLHEMFIVFARDTYLPASKHLGKDESVDVLEGRADVVLFDENGGIADVISVGDPSTGLPFYFRTPRERYHAWIMRSDVFVVQETTEGPLRQADTVFAPWCPETNDLAGVTAYQVKLIQEASCFRSKQT